MGRNLLVILGAGASYGSSLEEAPGAGTVPPLTEQLFSRNFDNVLRLFPGVEGLRSQINARVAQGGTLESVLADLAAVPHVAVRSQVAQIAPYLRWLIGASRADDNRPTAYDDLLLLIQERDLNVCFVTLNYDTLLERAIERRYGAPGRIRALSDYVQPEREWQLVKPHGSVAWAYRTDVPWSDDSPLISASREAYLPRYLELLEPAFTSGTLLFDPDPTSLHREGSVLYPALALPSDRKYGFVCPEDHIRALVGFVNIATDVLVIGNQGLDRDLMGLIAEAWPDTGGVVGLTVVDPHATSLFGRFAKVLPMTVTGAPVEAEFRSFVESGAAAALLAQMAAG